MATNKIYDFELKLGEQIRRLRITADYDQTALASMANISLGALKNLENGKGSSIKTLVQIVRALGREEWFCQLAPEPSVSPLQKLRDKHLQKPRSRVARR